MEDYSSRGCFGHKLSPFPRIIICSLFMACSDKLTFGCMTSRVFICNCVNHCRKTPLSACAKNVSCTKKIFGSVFIKAPQTALLLILIALRILQWQDIGRLYIGTIYTANDNSVIIKVGNPGCVLEIRPSLNLVSIVLTELLKRFTQKLIDDTETAEFFFIWIFEDTT